MDGEMMLWLWNWTTKVLKIFWNEKFSIRLHCSISYRTMHLEYVIRSLNPFLIILSRAHRLKVSFLLTFILFSIGSFFSRVKKDQRLSSLSQNCFHFLPSINPSNSSWVRKNSSRSQMSSIRLTCKQRHDWSMRWAKKREGGRWCTFSLEKGCSFRIRKPLCCTAKASTAKVFKWKTQTLFKLSKEWKVPQF